ncbi:GNAT family N-acetyltransferase [Vibrio sonorensis]|uniref:GNAT family N-acetyltransferase n=1 Tax=Vibrio sonorensis TaxID=1004316 RepID=UPI000A8D260F
MEISQATIKDVAQIAPLFDRYRVFYQQQSDVELATQFIVERLSNNQSVILFAKDDAGNTVGFTQLYPTFSSVSAKPSLILNDLYVEQEQRGKGIGKALLIAAKEYANKWAQKDWL